MLDLRVVPGAPGALLGGAAFQRSCCARWCLSYLIQCFGQRQSRGKGSAFGVGVGQLTKTCRFLVENACVARCRKGVAKVASRIGRALLRVSVCILFASGFVWLLPKSNRNRKAATFTLCNRRGISWIWISSEIAGSNGSAARFWRSVGSSFCVTGVVLGASALFLELLSAFLCAGDFDRVSLLLVTSDFVVSAILFCCVCRADDFVALHPIGTNILSYGHL